MNETNTSTATNKTSRKLSRTVRVVRSIDNTGNGIISIAVQKSKTRTEVNDYGVTLGLAYDGEALGIELRKDDGERYHVCLTEDPRHSTCECPGFLRWQQPCKHLQALRVLLDRGLLAIPAAAPAVEPFTCLDCGTGTDGAKLCKLCAAERASYADAEEEALALDRDEQMVDLDAVGNFPDTVGAFPDASLPYGDDPEPIMDSYERMAA